MVSSSFPGYSYSLVKNSESSVVEGIFLQDATMRSNFRKFPEVLLSDSTYRINDRNMPLYVLIVIDVNGNTHPVCLFFVTRENENSIRQMVDIFKETNEDWPRIETVLTDKDLTERAVFRSCFPQVMKIAIA